MCCLLIEDVHYISNLSVSLSLSLLLLLLLITSYYWYLRKATMTLTTTRSEEEVSQCDARLDWRSSICDLRSCRDGHARLGEESFNSGNLTLNVMSTVSRQTTSSGDVSANCELICWKNARVSPQKRAAIATLSFKL